MPGPTPYSEFSEYPRLTEAQRDILRQVGLTLFSVQGIEQTLRFVLNFVFPRDAAASLKDLLDGSNEDRRKTLGSFIHELRKRATVDPEFEKMLLKFLECRNRFVHHIFHERGFGMGDEAGIRAVQGFLDSFSYEQWIIGATLMGYVRLWGESMGLRDDQFNSSTYGRNLYKYWSPVLLPNVLVKQPSKSPQRDVQK